MLVRTLFILQLVLKKYWDYFICFQYDVFQRRFVQHLFSSCSRPEANVNKSVFTLLRGVYYLTSTVTLSLACF